MNRSSVFFLIVTLCSGLCPTLRADSGDKMFNQGKTLVRMGNSDIHEGLLDAMTRVNPSLKNRLENPAQKARLMENLVEQQLLFQESKKRGLDRQDAVREKIELYRWVIIGQAAVDDEIRRKAKGYYKDHANEFQALSLSSLFFPSSKKASADARQASQRLSHGESWEKVASMASKTGGLKTDAFLNRAELAKVIGDSKSLDSIFQLLVGKVSQPLQGSEGWYIVKLNAKKPQSFDEAYESISARLKSGTKSALISDLKQQTHIEYVDPSYAPKSGGSTEPSETVSPTPY